MQNSDRLMRKFNEMRCWHHLNLDKNVKNIPMNKITPTSNNIMKIKYEGAQNDIDLIGQEISLSSTVPACWLVKSNWTSLYEVLSSPSYEWATSSDGIVLTSLKGDTHGLSIVRDPTHLKLTNTPESDNTPQPNLKQVETLESGVAAAPPSKEPALPVEAETDNLTDSDQEFPISDSDSIFDWLDY